MAGRPPEPAKQARERRTAGGRTGKTKKKTKTETNEGGREGEGCAGKQVGGDREGQGARSAGRARRENACGPSTAQNPHGGRSQGEEEDGGRRQRQQQAERERGKKTRRRERDERTRRGRDRGERRKRRGINSFIGLPRKIITKAVRSHRHTPTEKLWPRRPYGGIGTKQFAEKALKQFDIVSRDD